MPKTNSQKVTLAKHTIHANIQYQWIKHNLGADEQSKNHRWHRSYNAPMLMVILFRF